MYSIVNDLSVEKHVGIDRITTKHGHHHNHHPTHLSLVTAANIGTHNGVEHSRSSLPITATPPSPIPQVYTTARFMQLAPLILANLDGVLPVLDIRTDGDSMLVVRSPSYDDVHGFLKHKKRFSEIEASFYFKQMMQIVNTAHRNGVVLRDLKLKKFVFTDSSRSTIVLSSLEDAILLTNHSNSSSNKEDLFDSRYGCPAYVAPEMLQPGLYSGRGADMWSAGVILYTLLVGHYPFFDANPQHLFRQIQSGYYSIPHTVSSLARSLICSLLCYDPLQRPSSYSVLQHPWLTNTSLLEDAPIFNNIRLLDLDQTVPTKKLLLQ